MRKLRNVLLDAMLKSRAKQNLGPKIDFSPFLREEYKYTLTLEAMKLLGAGNGAGSLGSLAALYYFSNKAALLGAIKIGAFAFSLGLLIAGVAVAALLLGITNGSDFLDKANTFEKNTDIPETVLNHGLASVIMLFASVTFAFVSFLCFCVGMCVALYAIARFPAG